MVKVGYLPDISKNFGYFRNMAIDYLNRHNWDGARSGVFNLNECLGIDYMVSINDREYTEQMKESSVYQCSHCTMIETKTINKNTEDEYEKKITVQTEIPTHEVTPFEMRLSDIHQLLLNQKTETVWICSKCNEINKMRETRKIVGERAKPFFLKVIAMPPVKQMGLDRQFPTKFKSWFWNAMEEITYQEYLYRTEYTHQNGQEMEENYRDNGDQ
ncbi:MAG: hypothetical protein HOD60_03060 [Candidatus Nitrosopelagicus sp.]|nr:hypothetical protein [Candidatus Nitrosopelagicus sp.]